MNIYEKLLKIQAELKAPKTQFNKFGNYNYRSCEDILEAVKPLCKTAEAVTLLSDELTLIGERYYIKATAKLIDTKEPTNFIEVSAFAREEADKKGMDGSQITGASSSYARKYALNGLFNIDDTKDSDSTNDKNGKVDTPKTPEAPKTTPPKSEATAEPKSDLEIALNYSFKDGKPFGKYTDKELESIINNKKFNSPKIKVFAKAVLDSRTTEQAAQEEPIEIDTPPITDDDLPF